MHAAEVVGAEKLLCGAETWGAVAAVSLLSHVVEKVCFWVASGVRCRGR